MHRFEKTFFYTVFILLFLFLFVSAMQLTAQNTPIFFMAERGQSDVAFPGKVIRQLNDSSAIIKIDNRARPTGFSLHPPPTNWKLGPGLLEQVDRAFPAGLIIVSENMAESLSFIKGLSSVQIQSVRKDLGMILLKGQTKELIRLFQPRPEILYLGLAPGIPEEERPQRSFDPAVQAIPMLRSRFPNADGFGQVVSLKEFSPDSSDIDLQSAYLPSPLAASTVNFHATDMASLLVGRGASFYTGLGIAPQALLSSSSFLQLLPDTLPYYLEAGIRVQNHSYGSGIQQYYGPIAHGYDQQVVGQPDLVHIFSAGNRGSEVPDTGNYAGLKGFANLTGEYKMAKNVLVVGAVDSFLQLEPLSSRGPTYDGRIKPELVAFGSDGSSGAAAITSGVCLLLQQVYREQEGGAFPSVALLRAILLNTAEDLGTEGPDYLHGYGNVQAAAALETLVKGQFFEGRLERGARRSYYLEIPENINHVRITLTWTDPPAPINNFQALVNDLDLRLLTPSGDTLLPWALSSAPHIDSLSAPARRASDHLNNQEQLSLTQPKAGTYEILISGFSILDSQDFAVAFDLQEERSFEWRFPAAGDRLQAGQRAIVRWFSNLPDTLNGELDYFDPATQNWQNIGAPQVKTGWLNWIVPNKLMQTQLRLTTTSRTFLSDTFLIAPTTRGRLINLCDTFLDLTWDPVIDAAGYRVFAFRNGWMQSIGETTNTLFRIPNPTSSHFSVAPLLDQEEAGLRSVALNLDFQARGCYLDQFFAELEEQDVLLQAFLTTTHEVDSVIFEGEAAAGQFKALLKQAPTTSLEYTHRATDLKEGVNRFRLRLRLADGSSIISETKEVFFLPKGELILFPNPLKQGSFLEIISSDTNDPPRFELFSANGQLIWELLLFNPLEVLPSGQLPAGIYFYRLTQNGDRVNSGKLVIY